MDYKLNYKRRYSGKYSVNLEILFLSIVKRFREYKKEFSVDRNEKCYEIFEKFRKL